jgi:hypothetical protein
MYNSTNTVVYFDGKDGNLYLRLRAMSHTIYAAKFEQMITHQYMLLRRIFTFELRIAYINYGYKSNNKITELRTIFQRESQNS